MKHFYLFFSSKLVRKLLLRIVSAEILAFLLLMVLSATLLLPKLITQAKIKSDETSQQIINMVDQIHQTSLNYSKLILTSDELEKALISWFNGDRSDAGRTSINLLLHKMISSQDSISYVYITDEEGNVFDSISKTQYTDPSFFTSDLYARISKTPYSSGFWRTYSVYLASEGVANPAKYMMTVFAQNYQIGYHRVTMSLFINITHQLATIEKTKQDFVDAIKIYDTNGLLIYENGVAPVSSYAETQSVFPLNAYSESVSAHNGHWNLKTCANGFWKIYSFTSNQTLSKQVQGIYYTTSILFVMMMFMTFIFITPVAYRLIKPINHLASVMKGAAKGNLSVFPDIHTKDEIEDLSHEYIEMMHRLKQYIESIYEHEKAEQRMKYGLLISQIDPHFIYNTMNIINSLARKGRTEDIISINSALIKIMQDRLRITDIQVFDTIHREISILKEYISIIDFRYENKVKVQFEIPERLENEEIPKNLFQPLVENAFFHGLTDDDGVMSGIIRVSVEEAYDQLILRVSDNGKGFSPEQQQKVLSSNRAVDTQRGRHIGLANVKERLKHLYGNDQCMQIESRKGFGTTVSLLIRRNAQETENL